MRFNDCPPRVYDRPGIGPMTNSYGQMAPPPWPPYRDRVSYQRPVPTDALTLGWFLVLWPVIIPAMTISALLGAVREGDQR